MKRKLGTNERVVWLSTQAGSLNFVNVAHLSNVLDEHVLRKALDLLPQRHPLLKTRIEIQGNELLFNSDAVPQIPLRTEVRCSDDHWYDEAEKEINSPFPCFEGPLVRVVLLRGDKTSDILITFHHIIGDGMSGVYLMRDLLQLAGQITRGITPVVEPFPERPPMEDMLPARGMDGLVKTASLIGKQARTILVLRPKKLPKDGEAPKEECRAHIIHQVLSQKETQNLVTRCREESTTVHGALCAALLKASAALICDVTEKERPIPVSFMSTVDLRQFLNPPVGEEVGFFVSLVITGQNVARTTKFWDLARTARDEVYKSIEKGEQFIFISLLDKLFPKGATPTSLTKRASSIYPAALLVTNLGRLTIPEEYGPLFLQKFHMALADTSVPEHFTASVVTYRDELTINFSYTEPTLSEEHANTLVEDTMKALRSLA